MEEQIVYICRHCRYVASDVEDAKKHLQNKHRLYWISDDSVEQHFVKCEKKVIKVKINTSYKCTLCNYKGKTFKGALMHLKTKHDSSNTILIKVEHKDVYTIKEEHKDVYTTSYRKCSPTNNVGRLYARKPDVNLSIAEMVAKGNITLIHQDDVVCECCNTPRTFCYLVKYNGKGKYLCDCCMTEAERVWETEKNRLSKQKSSENYYNRGEIIRYKRVTHSDLLDAVRNHRGIRIGENMTCMNCKTIYGSGWLYRSMGREYVVCVNCKNALSSGKMSFNRQCIDSNTGGKR